MSDADEEPWIITIVLLEGLRLMRPEKSWRPIITIDVDNHHFHETTLGVDGQCVNQKEIFSFENATCASTVEVKVWQKSQSKKKGKRRNLVASATKTLGELANKQEHEARVDLPLQCRAADGTRSVSSRGRPQKGAMLRLKLRKPQRFMARVDVDTMEATESTDIDHSYPSCSSSASVSASSAPSSRCPTPPPLPVSTSAAKPRKRKGYIIDSDCPDDSSDGGDDPEVEIEDTMSWRGDDSIQTLVEDDYSATVIIHRETHETHLAGTTTFGWIAAALLPTYTEAIKVPPTLNRFERGMAKLTMYSELKTACMDSHYDEVFKRLQMEWTYIGGLLVALAAVNTAVFSISGDSIITVGSYARGAVAASSISSGLGIACDAWFLLRYNWADLQTFKTRAKDVYGSYFFFSLSSRMPAFCMFISAFSLMTFLGLVAFDIWPQGVTVVCFVVGVVMSLQFLVYGAHWFGSKVVEGGRVGTRSIGRVVKRTMTL